MLFVPLFLIIGYSSFLNFSLNFNFTQSDNVCLSMCIYFTLGQAVDFSSYQILFEFGTHCRLGKYLGKYLFYFFKIIISGGGLKVEPSAFAHNYMCKY